MSLAVNKNSLTQEITYDGIIEDITEQSIAEKEKQKLIDELQTSILFLNQSVGSFINKGQS